MTLTIGEHAYLNHDVTMTAAGDHEAVLLGKKGERVKLLKVESYGTYPYTVEGTTTPGKRWLANLNDLSEGDPLRMTDRPKAMTPANSTEYDDLALVGEQR